MDDYESEKSRKVAEAALKSGDYDKARRFLLKSLKIQPDNFKARAMLAECDARGGNAGPRKMSGPRPSAQSSGNTPEETKARFNTRDAEICDEILKKTDYYDILGVPKTAPDDVIKKQYKKLALKLHPDKNRAPQATDAFKKLTQAFACLTDKGKRKVYDEHGSEQNFRQQYHQYFRDEDTFDPDDIFEMFFTGRVNPNRRRRRQQYYRSEQPDPQHEQENGQPAGRYRGLLTFLPLLLVLLLTFFLQSGNFSGNNSYNRRSYANLFSLEKEQPFVVTRTTERAEVEYYVTKEFGSTISKNMLPELEREVELLYMQTMAQQCNYVMRAKQYLQNDIGSGRLAGNELKKKERELRGLSFESCDEYNRVRNA